MRLIDADVLLKELNILEPRCANKYVKQGLDDALHYYMPQILEEQPTIDAVPVKHSFWEEYETSTFGGYDETGDVRWWSRRYFRCERCRKGSAIKSSFCPNCGADMRERKDGDG